MIENYLSEMAEPVKALEVLLDVIVSNAEEDGIRSGKYDKN